MHIFTGWFIQWQSKSLISWFCVHRESVKTERLQVQKHINLTPNKCRGALMWANVGCALCCPKRKCLQYLELAPKPTELKGRFFCCFQLGIRLWKLMLKALWTTFPGSHICWQICRGPFSLTAAAWGFRAPASLRGCCSAVTCILNQFSIYGSFPA